ncbi:MAG: hypothetical protein LBB31_02190, partial [Prevotellaceae bacterium]|nr:hypothetical protein [Prevotellaceae bacterium]
CVLQENSCAGCKSMCDSVGAPYSYRYTIHCYCVFKPKCPGCYVGEGADFYDWKNNMWTEVYDCPQCNWNQEDIFEDCN